MISDVADGRAKQAAGGSLLRLVPLSSLMVLGTTLSVTAVNFTTAINGGDLLMLGAIVSWAGYAVGVHRAKRLLSGDVLLFVTALTGVVCVLPLYAVETAFVRAFRPSPKGLFAIAYLAVASTALAVYLWNVSIRSVGASRAGVFVNLIPVFGALFAMLFLGERLYAFHVAGALLVFAGIVLAVRRTRAA